MHRVATRSYFLYMDVDGNLYIDDWAHGVGTWGREHLATLARMPSYKGMESSCSMA
jgi:hypothetical protein